MNLNISAWHKFEGQVEFEDVDLGGVVHHARYFNYLERARSRFFHEKTISAMSLYDARIAFTVGRANAQYNVPIHAYQKIYILSRIAAVTNCSIDFEQFIYVIPVSDMDLARERRKKEPAFQSNVRMVCVDTKSGKSITIPDSILVKLAAC